MENLKHKHKEGVQLFVNKELELEVRAVEINGEGWLVGKDVAEVLGYKNPRKALLDHVDEEDKGVTKCDTLGGSQEMTVINESGLYSLVLRSKLPGAKKFRRWVTSEVLPQIRKTGGYIEVKKDDDEASIMARALMIAQNTLNKKDELLKAKEKELAETKEDLTEKNRFIGQISASKNSILVRDLAHMITKQNLKIGEKRLWQKLRDWGLISKGTTEPKQHALERNLFEVTAFAIQTNHGVTTRRTTRVTGKGQAYIIDRLVKEGV